jgi:hypothetical protein
MKITSPRNPQWADSEKTVIDLTVTSDEYGDIPLSVSKKDDTYGLFAKTVKGDFGPIMPYRPPPPPTSRQLAAMADAERLRRVVTAYVDGEKRTSAYGYFARLGAINEEDRTDEQKFDMETLIAAADWEDEMIGRVNIIVDMNSAEAVTRDSSWPKLSVDMAARLKTLAEQC